MFTLSLRGDLGQSMSRRWESPARTRQAHRLVAASWRCLGRKRPLVHLRTGRGVAPATLAGTVTVLGDIVSPALPEGAWEALDVTPADWVAEGPDDDEA